MKHHMKKDLKSEKKSSENNYIYSFALIIGIISFWGIFLRFYNLGVQSFWMDEGYSTLVSLFAYKNNFVPINPIGQHYYSYYLHTIFQVISFKLFGISDFSARFFSVIFSIATWIIIINWLREFFRNKKSSKNIVFSGIILISFLLLFSYNEILWSRQARFYSLLELLYISNLYFIWKYFDTKKLQFVVFIGFFTILGIWLHPFFYGIPIIFLINLIFVEKYYKLTLKKGVPIIGIILAIILLLYFTRIGNNIFGIIRNFYIFGFIYRFSIYSFYLFYESRVIFVIFLLSFLYFLRKKEYKDFIFFSSVFFINLIVISSSQVFAMRYINHIFAMIFLQSVYFIFVFYNESIIQNFSKTTKNLGIITLFASIIFFHNFQLIPISNYITDNTAPQFDFKEAYSYLNSQTNGESKIVSGIAPLCTWYNIDNPSRCIGAFRINQTGNESEKIRVLNDKTERYSGIKYFNNSSELPKDKFYFVTDDFSLTTIVDASFVDYIGKKCKIFWKKGKVTSGQGISIWECN